MECQRIRFVSIGRQTRSICRGGKKATSEEVHGSKKEDCAHDEDDVDAISQRSWESIENAKTDPK
jgi:hypothetical protein